MPTKADLLADLLDGNVDPADVPADVAELASLAESVSQHIALVPPTDAFRAALRDEVLQSAGGAGGAGGAATTASTATTTAATGGGLAAIVAGVAATAVLATSTVAAADRAGPGDLLAGLDRGLESVQLAIADDEREAELLVDFAAERVLEAVELVDPVVVNELLQRAEALLEEALALGVDQARDLEELLEPYRAALLTLASRTEDPGVQARVAQLLDDAGLGGASIVTGDDPDAPALGDDPAAPAPGGGQEQDAPAGSDDGEGEPSDEPVDDATEPLDDATEPLDDATEPLDDATEPLDDATEPLDDATEPLDDATEPLDELDDPLDDADDQPDSTSAPLDDAAEPLP